MQQRNTILSTAVSVFMICIAMSHAVQAKDIVGWVEKVEIRPGNLELKAKIDSGAKNSSLHCDCKDFFEKDGEKWVGFTVSNENGDKIRLEKKIERMATIKRHHGASQERPVVKMGVCLGEVYKEIEVNVIDRTGFNYQMLIGRNFLAGDFLIDPGVKYLRPPQCLVD